MTESVMSCECSACGAPAPIDNEKAKEPCLYCGCTHKTVRMKFFGEVKLHGILKAKAKAHVTGKTKVEIITGEEFSAKAGKYVEKHRRIDRENDRYQEDVIDKETGEIVHHSDEPLSKHQGHGSAKHTKGN